MWLSKINLCIQYRHAYTLNHFLYALFLHSILKVFDVNIFFDRQRKHCESAKLYVDAGSVPTYVKNNC